MREGVIIGNATGNEEGILEARDSSTARKIKKSANRRFKITQFTPTGWKQEGKVQEMH